MGGTGQEMIAACLSSPMVAGTTYVINMWMAKARGNPTLQFTIFGTPNCSDLPFTGTKCPIGQGSWEVLGQTWVNFSNDGDWHEVTVSFTPNKDIKAVTLGSDCQPQP